MGGVQTLIAFLRQVLGVALDFLPYSITNVPYTPTIM